jgi:hypothetical protein
VGERAVPHDIKFIRVILYVTPAIAIIATSVFVFASLGNKNE